MGQAQAGYLLQIRSQLRQPPVLVDIFNTAHLTHGRLDHLIKISRFAVHRPVHIIAHLFNDTHVF